MRYKDVTIDDLNEYCLLQICTELCLKDQYALSQLNTRFNQIVQRCWRIEYNQVFNAEQEHQLKVLPHVDQMQILANIATETRALLKMNATQCNLLQQTNAAYPNIEVLSIKDATQTELNLQHLARTCPNLRALQLLSCKLNVGEETLCTLLKQLAALRSFVLLPDVFERHTELASNHIKFGDALQDVRLPSAMLTVKHMDVIVQMRQLRALTLYDSDKNDDDDDDLCYSNNKTTAHISDNMLYKAIENLLPAARRCQRQVIELQLKCQLDRRLLQLLLGALKDNAQETELDGNSGGGGQCQISPLYMLRHLTWNSMLRVYHNNKTGIIKWQTHDPQVERFLLKFIREAHNLDTIDLRSNLHITTSYIQNVMLTLGERAEFVNVLHDNMTCSHKSKRSHKMIRHSIADTIENVPESKQAYVKLKFL